MPHEQRYNQFGAAVKAVAVGLSFGLCLGVQIYILGVLLGGWLDQKIGSSPWCVIVGVLLAIAVGFRQLFSAVEVWQKKVRISSNKKVK